MRRLSTKVLIINISLLAPHSSVPSLHSFHLLSSEPTRKAAAASFHIFELIFCTTSVAKVIPAFCQACCAPGSVIVSSLPADVRGNTGSYFHTSRDIEPLNLHFELDLTPGSSVMFQQAMGQGSSNRPSFRYKPLDPSVDCIRLLVLYPYDKKGRKLSGANYEPSHFWRSPNMKHCHIRGEIQNLPRKSGLMANHLPSKRTFTTLQIIYD